MNIYISMVNSCLFTHQKERNQIFILPFALSSDFSNKTFNKTVRLIQNCDNVSHQISNPQIDSLSSVTYICWYESQLRFLRLRQVKNLPDTEGRKKRRRLENHVVMMLLFISCSSVSSDTLISPITSKISDADGTTGVSDCRWDHMSEYV